MTDENGEVVVIYEYRAFGEQLKRLDASGDDTGDEAKYSYGGKELDEESNLYYFNARYYDATIGRFINVDPVQDGSNWYVYCSNNPLTMVDPTGLKNDDTVTADVYIKGNGSIIQQNYDETRGEFKEPVVGIYHHPDNDYKKATQIKDVHKNVNLLYLPVGSKGYVYIQGISGKSYQAVLKDPGIYDLGLMAIAFDAAELEEKVFKSMDKANDKAMKDGAISMATSLIGPIADIGGRILRQHKNIYKLIMTASSVNTGIGSGNTLKNYFTPDEKNMQDQLTKKFIEIYPPHMQRLLGSQSQYLSEHPPERAKW